MNVSDKLMIILILGVIVMFLIVPTNRSNKTGQSVFISKETNAIANSSPISIKKFLVFDSDANITQRICYEEQALFTYNSTLMYAKYQGFYIPTTAELEAGYFPNLNYTKLIDQRVFLDFMLHNNNNASAPYIISKIYTKGNEVYWIFNQDTGNSNNNAINIKENITIATLSPQAVNGVIFLNGTALISPANPGIDNGKYIFQNC